MKKLFFFLAGSALVLLLSYGGAFLATTLAGGGEDHSEQQEQPTHEEAPLLLKVSFSSSPRFPVAGRKADLEVRVSDNGAGSHIDEATVHVHLAPVETEGHHAMPSMDSDAMPSMDSDAMPSMASDEEPHEAEDAAEHEPDGGMPEDTPQEHEGEQADGEHEPDGGMPEDAPQEHEGEQADGEHEHEGDELGHEDEDAIVLEATRVAPGVYSARYVFNEGGRYDGHVHVGDVEAGELSVSVRSTAVAWWLVISIGSMVLITAVTVALLKTLRRQW